MMDNRIHTPREPILNRAFCEVGSMPAEYPALVLVHRQPEVVPTHWHSGVEVNYVVEGGGSVTIDSRVEALHPGKLCIISPYTPHSFITESRGGKAPLILSITYDSSRIERIYKKADLYVMSVDSARARDEDRQALIDLCLRMIDTTRMLGPERVFGINAILFDILFLLYQNFVVRCRPRSSPRYRYHDSRDCERYRAPPQRTADRCERGRSARLFARAFQPTFPAQHRDDLQTVRHAIAGRGRVLPAHGGAGPHPGRYCPAGRFPQHPGAQSRFYGAARDDPAGISQNPVREEQVKTR